MDVSYILCDVENWTELVPESIKTRTVTRFTKENNTEPYNSF